VSLNCRALAGAVTAVLLACVLPAVAHAHDPIAPNLASGISAASGNPAAPPPGVNRSSCRLTDAHPRPVILIDATFGNMEDDYGALGPILANDGYCVVSAAIGAPADQFIQTIGPVTDSARQIADLIDQTLAQYGVSQVDLVGHSEGGLIAEYLAKVLGYAPKIHRIIALSPTTHGTTLDGLVILAWYGANGYVQDACPACYDQEIGSSVVDAVDNGPIAQPGVAYTVIETENENVVTPVGSSFIDEPGVVNEYVQSWCSNDSVDHVRLTYDNTTIRLVLNALSPASAKPPNCWISYPYWGAMQQ